MASGSVAEKYIMLCSIYTAPFTPEDVIQIKNIFPSLYNFD
jgi:hypothetical protein